MGTMSSVPKVDTSQYESFDAILSHLDELVGEVRDKSTSLERSLDLLDEAVALGSKAVDLVDTAELSARESSQEDVPEATGDAGGHEAG